MTEECVTCGGEARLTSGQQEIPVGSRVAIVTGEYMECAGCGETYFLPGQMTALWRAATDKVRADLHDNPIDGDTVL